MSHHQDEVDVSFKQMMEAALKWVYGTDAEIRHPRSRADVLAKVSEAHQAIDQMSASTGRLAEVQPAKTLHEALSQLSGER